MHTCKTINTTKSLCFESNYVYLVWAVNIKINNTKYCLLFKNSWLKILSIIQSQYDWLLDTLSVLTVDQVWKCLTSHHYRIIYFNFNNKIMYLQPYTCYSFSIRFYEKTQPKPIPTCTVIRLDRIGICRNIPVYSGIKMFSLHFWKSLKVTIIVCKSATYLVTSYQGIVEYIWQEFLVPHLSIIERNCSTLFWWVNDESCWKTSHLLCTQYILITILLFQCVDDVVFWWFSGPPNSIKR